MPLRKVTDGPLFGAGPGVLSALQNMTLQPGGYAEARGGLEKLKPLGGTAADALAAGGHSDVIQTSTSYGWVRTFDTTAAVNFQYSTNRQLDRGGWLAFGRNAAPVAQCAMYWGADSPFSRISTSMSVAGAWATFVEVYEYWNGAAWSALTTAETIDFTTLRTPTYGSWTIPTDWAANTVGDSGTGNVLKYWMRIRITSITVVTAIPCVGVAKGYWVGMREVYAATQSPRTSATSGALKRQGQTGTTEEWFSVGTSAYSGTASPTRMVEYRGRTIMLNGKETKRFDGAAYSTLGGTPTLPGLLPVAVGAGILGAGIWRYYAALGDGPCQNIAAYADRQDALPLYGFGRAWYMAEVTTVAGQRVQLTTGGGGTYGASSYFIFRTDDLTNVAVGDRGNMPAYLIQSFRMEDAAVGTFENAFGAGGIYYDDSLAYAFPLQEALAFDLAPPGTGTSREVCKYPLIYQNRLIMGDDETWYISDPFLPDRFSTKATTGYIRLSRAQGGRNMGGTEFADQAVLFTENQTWGLTNVDLDVPQLFPIHPGVGCVAPDSIAVGDGVLMWMARDGFYAWDGGREGPRKVSEDMDTTFLKLSYETHGGSKAVISDRKYWVRLSTPDYGTLGLAYCFNMETAQWGTVVHAGLSSTMFPLTTIHAPLGNNDAGYLHPLWGKVDYGTGAGDYSLYLGELTTQDNGSDYTCSATMHFPLPPDKLLKPSRVKAYYQAANGWATPSLAFATTDIIGSSVGTLNTGTPDTGTDYSIVGGTFNQQSSGTSDLKVTFSAVSAAGGTVNTQRLFGAIIQGQAGGFRRGAV